MTTFFLDDRSTFILKTGSSWLAAFYPFSLCVGLLPHGSSDLVCLFDNREYFLIVQNVDE